MPHVVAIAFDRLDAADETLHRLRSPQSEALRELDDACVAQRDGGGELQLKQAVASRLAQALHPEFWRQLLEHVLRHDQATLPASGRTAGLGLDCGFVREVAAALGPNSSALFLLVRDSEPRVLIEMLNRYKGNVLHCDLAGTVCETLAAALAPPPPRFASAAELRELAEKAVAQRMLEDLESREKEERERIGQIERLRKQPLGSAQLRAIMAAVNDAARNGKMEVLAFQFPSDLCTDRGRAVNNDEPTWPDSLTGQPRQFYELWRDHLRPKGYRLQAHVLDYPGGMPGNIGFTLSWS